MKNLGTVATVLLLLISMNCWAEEQANFDAIQGEWKLVGFERGGVARTSDQVPSGWIRFQKGGGFAASFPNHDMGGTIEIDFARKPGSIDFEHTWGLDKGHAMFAVFKLQEGKLYLCSAPPGKPKSERPAEFTTRHTDFVLFTFERQPLAPAPEGFDTQRDGVEHGKIETREYDSKTIGVQRPLTIYTPPGYSKDVKYPVLYLLHGAGQNETYWQKHGAVEVILDNLHADKKLIPMIVVMPHAATERGAPHDDPYRPFVADLLQDIVPFVESTYSVQADREHRAIAGLSKGGAQAVWIGLKHRKQFAWIGGFSSALHGDAKTTAPVVHELVGDPTKVREELRLLWLSCGDADELLMGNEHFRDALDALLIPNVWHVDSGGHTWMVWKNDLCLFSQRLFRSK